MERHPMTLRRALLAGTSTMALLIVGAPGTARAVACVDNTNPGVGQTCTGPLNWTTGDLTVEGTVSGSGRGIIVDSGATVGTLTSSGTINGGFAGIRVNGTISALINTGVWSNAAYGLNEGVGGTLGTLTNSGTIAGLATAIYWSSGTLGTLTNSGTLTGSRGIKLAGGAIGTASNSGLISATGTAIYLDSGTLGTLTNSGTLAGTQKGLAMFGGALTTVTNSGLLSGRYAVYMNGGSIGALTNSGTISSSVAIGLFMTGGTIGTLTNSGTIFGANTGIFMTSGTIGTLTNTGTIRGARTALIMGGGSTFGTLTNSGLISGNINTTTLNTLTIAGGSGSTFGTLAGGTINSTSANLVFSSGNLWLKDHVNVTGHTLTNTGATVKVTEAFIPTITGNYNQTGGGLVIGVGNATSYGYLNVTGNATVANATVTISGSGLAVGQTYTIVRAGGTGSYTNDIALVEGGAFGATVSTVGRTMVVSLIAGRTVDGGVIDLSRPFFTQNDAPAQSAAVIFDGGTLRPSAALALTNPVTVRATGGIINPNSGNLTLSGAISAAGPLTVSGTGSVTISGTLSGSGQLGVTDGSEVMLSGTDQSTGGALVRDGLLRVAGALTGPVEVQTNGMLRGTGTIGGATSVTGTLSPGASPGTLHFTAPVTMLSSGVLALDIDGTGTGTGAGNYSRVIVTGGNSFTAAGTLMPKLRGITYSAGETPGSNSYSPGLGTKFAGVVQADGGILGSFAGLTQPDGRAAGTRFDAVYGTNTIDLYVTPASYGALSAAGLQQTRNQSALGAALDTIRPTAGMLASGDIKAVFDALAPLDGAALPRALTQIAGEGNANLPSTAVDVGRTFGAPVTTRLGQMRGGSGVAAEASRGLPSLYFGSGGNSQSGFVGSVESGAGAFAAPTAADSGLAAGDGVSGDKLSVWARGFGKFTDNRGDGNNPGFNRAIGGGLAGGDLPVLDELRVGAVVGYARSDVTGGQSSGDVTADSYHAGVYAGWTPGPWFATADLGVTWSRFETTRTLQFGSIDRTARGKTDAIGGNAAFEVGHRFDLAGYALEPSLDLRYDVIRANGYTESGADGFNLSVKSGTHHALRAGLGTKVSRTLALEDGLLLEPDLSVRWEHDVLDQTYQTAQSIGGSAFTVNAARPGRDAAVLGAGVAAVLDANLKLYAHYDAELRAHQTDHVITAGMRYRW